MSQDHTNCGHAYINRIVQDWDISLADDKAKLSICTTKHWWVDLDGELNVDKVDEFSGSFVASELTYQILSTYRKWNPISVYLKLGVGRMFLNENIILLSTKHGCPDICNKIYFYDKLDMIPVLL